MKKLTYWVFMLFACIAITSCTDDDMPTDKASVRDYQTDAEVLAKFVDVNKTLGEYYINENKKKFTNGLCYKQGLGRIDVG